MTRRHFTAAGILTAAAGLSLLTAPGASAWELDREASHIELIGTADGREAVTRVEAFDVELEGDPDDPASGSLVLVLHSASITSGSAMVDDMLHGRNWFDVESHPRIVYRSTAIHEPAPGELHVEGELEVLGESYPLEVPVGWGSDGERVRAEGRLSLDRTDFDVGRGAWRTEGTVKHEVHVDFALELVAP
ncbi:YceI family protein [Halomonas sp. C05BenzN]|uniref:YceI family protein n=1 Tax=Halomonas sp. C05BenzN TaxID=3411041 RepID=UPI003B94AC20